MKTVVVDVDLTLVDTLTPWITWWEGKTGKEFNWEIIGPGSSVNTQLESEMTREETMAYWRQEDLYDSLLPLPRAYSVLKWYKAQGYDIYFVSKCEDEHYQSKLRFLDEHFPFHDGLISTPRKHFIEADIYFEDFGPYIKDIIKHRPHAKVYQYVTKANSYKLVPGAKVMTSWEDYYELHFA